MQLDVFHERLYPFPSPGPSSFQFTYAYDGHSRLRIKIDGHIGLPKASYIYLSPSRMLREEGACPTDPQVAAASCCAVDAG
ncbi:hypothetical protein H0H87_001119 [Tephrocybe sp. NHM501043]|nr:hypothetical protein H0H87_001119 [Tephrocybe sp. NHM501043]